MVSAESICGKYLGLKKVTEGREDELSPKERKELERAKPDVPLLLRPDGTFQRQITEGTWVVRDTRVVFSPTTFGGETHAVMKRRTEDMGRTFTLAFVFQPFELRIVGDGLMTPDETALIVTEFRRNW